MLLASLVDDIGQVLVTLGVSWPKFIGQLVGFVVILIVLRIWAYKPVLGILEERRKRIAESLDNAEKIKTQLAQTDTDRKRILQEAHEQANKIVQEAQKSATVLSDKKLQETVLQVEALLKKAEEARALEREQMLSEIKKELAHLVIATTTKVAGKVLTQQDQERLNQETLTQLSRN